MTDKILERFGLKGSKATNFGPLYNKFREQMRVITDKYKILRKKHRRGKELIELQIEHNIEIDEKEFQKFNNQMN
jgi:hypothetical protein